MTNKIKEVYHIKQQSPSLLISLQGQQLALKVDMFNGNKLEVLPSSKPLNHLVNLWSHHSISPILLELEPYPIIGNLILISLYVHLPNKAGILVQLFQVGVSLPLQTDRAPPCILVLAMLCRDDLHLDMGCKQVPLA